MDYADKAIKFSPSNNLGFFWKSCNLGRWGEVKGIMESLFKAEEVVELLIQSIELNPMLER